ncbi:MAG: tagaturonate reductase [Clostridiaceae bacterium]|nr:tagaturonate reductase [Clostridiaceae bacterium]
MSDTLPRLNRQLAASIKPLSASAPVKVVQFGEGVFLRGFVDWIFYTLNQSGCFHGSIAVVQPIAQGRVADLRRQDGLYTLFLRGIEQGRIRQERQIIDVISQCIDPYADFDSYLRLAENPDLQVVVSNTTEAGITWLPGCSLHDRPAASYPAKLTQFLYHRFLTFSGDAAKGLILLPCELIDRNGDHLRDHILHHAADWDLPAAFTSWLLQNCRFCNTLVDRIVTGFPRNEIAELQAEAGYQDDFYDTAEYFHLWVIEGKQEPALPFADAGLNVIWTDNLARYRDRKVRVLNGLHTATFAAALLSGVETVGAALTDPDIHEYMTQTLYREIIPTLPLSRQESEQYAAAVLERFANPFIEHRWLSIALNSISKFKVRVLPSLLAYGQQQNAQPRHLSFAFAALLLFYRGGAEAKPADDPAIIDFFTSAWAACDPTSASSLDQLVSTLLGRTELWEQDLTLIPGLAGFVSEQLGRQINLGMREAVRQLDS